MATNVHVEKNANENSTSLIRRFTKRVQGSGILRRVKSIRFRERELSSVKRKQERLKKISKMAERERLIKLGKIQENRFGGGRR